MTAEQGPAPLQGQTTLMQLAALADCDLFDNLGDEEMQQILQRAQRIRVESGEVVCRQGEIGQSMYLIVAGRVRVTASSATGQELLLNTLGFGCHFGEVAMLTRGPRTATVTALIDTELLKIGHDSFHELVSTIPGFAANLSRTLGRWLRGQLSGRQHRGAIGIGAMLHTADATAALAPQVARTLVETGRSLAVFSLRSEFWRQQGIDAHPLSADDYERGRLRGRLAQAAREQTHVLIDLPAAEAQPDLLRHCELVWWVLDQDQPEASLQEMTDRFGSEPRLLARTQLVWVQQTADRLPAAPVHGLDLRHPELRVRWSRGGAEPFSYRRSDLHRLAHRWIGVQLGLALGGGGARGIAHLGVLKVLDEEGLYFDRFAGTSAGAIIAGAYGAGLTAEHTLELFAREMSPPRWLRWLPTSRRWYLLTLFRLGLVEPKFRRYVGQTTFEQLLVPTHVVAVDLLRGEQVVRESGDVAGSVLESVNHPVFGKPILRNGEALVDGGVLNNVPASVLRERGADFVVAVDVGAKLGNRFGRLSADHPKLRSPGYFSTLTRVLDVAQRGLAVHHMSQSDFLIEPDTSLFPFEDFTQGAGLVAAGEAAARQAVPQLKQMINDFISQT